MTLIRANIQTVDDILGGTIDRSTASTAASLVDGTLHGDANTSGTVLPCGGTCTTIGVRLISDGSYFDPFTFNTGGRPATITVNVSVDRTVQFEGGVNDANFSMQSLLELSPQTNAPSNSGMGYIYSGGDNKTGTSPSAGCRKTMRLLLAEMSD